MAYNSFRKADMDAERELAKFLDLHLYNNGIFQNVHRTDDPNSQMEGSDIIVSIPSLGLSNIIVDEKASIYYINKPLNTFVLELSFVNKQYHLQEGWFTNESLKTQYYLIQWIKANVENPRDVTAETITEIECVLVSKQKIYSFLSQFGYDKNALRMKAKEIRDKDIDGSFEKSYDKPFWFFFTKRLAEKPINLLLTKQAYFEICDMHFIVKPTECIRIK